MKSVALLLSLMLVSIAHAQDATPIKDLAPAQVNALRLSAYITADEVLALDLAPDAFSIVTGKLRGLGVTRVFIEVYRGATVVPVPVLVAARDAFEAQAFEVYGGIATVPGGEVGVRQDGPLGWFNWQNEKTQRDLAEVMRNAAPVFHHFIIDDFLCTGDVSAESEQAKGDRSWADYRRALMTQVARDVLVTPAREANPSITMIVKFPQWYDLFQRHGYDVENMPPLFDEVYIGTETRGARTQRYGFVQPYEGFVNFRWISAIAGAKTRGAWFDHGDTADHDFVEQAYQSVLAGANEIVLFHFGALMEGHPDHARLVEAFPTLVELALAIDNDPVTGVVAYKPPQSDAKNDVFIMDFIGMLGVPLVPSPTFPADAAVIFLPTQASADPDLQAKVLQWLGPGRTLLMTAGFLDNVTAVEGPDSPTYHELAGLAMGPGTVGPLETESIGPPDVHALLDEPRTLVHDLFPEAEAIGRPGALVPLDKPLTLAHDLFPETAQVVLEATVIDRTEPVPFLTRHVARGGTVYVLNTQTFRQEDFDAVNEVLLAPKDLGLLYLPREQASIVRNAFLEGLGLTLDAPARVTFQPFGKQYMIYNYNDEAVEIALNCAIDSVELSVRPDKQFGGSWSGISTSVPARGYHLIQK